MLTECFFQPYTPQAVPGLGEPQQVLAQLATLPPAQSGALLQQLLQVPGLVQQTAAAGQNPNPGPNAPASLLQQLAAAAAQQAPAAQHEHSEGAQQVSWDPDRP